MSRSYVQPGLFVAGEWILDAAGREALAVTNPANGQILAQLPLATASDLDAAIEAAGAAFAGWRGTPALQRSEIVRRAGALIRQRRDLIGQVIAQELGKPLQEAQREADTAAEMFEWAAEECRRSYGRIIPGRTPGQSLQAVLEPIGPVAAFAPWNAPAITPARKIAGALAAGCTLVIKAAEETPSTATLVVRAAQDAGVPAGVLNLVFGDPVMISQILLSSPVIRAMTFTGSTEVGRGLAAQAGAGLKRMTLELGGHAPVLVFEDTDIEAVAAAAVAAKYRNAGQVCTSPTRFYIQQDVYGRFVDRFAALARDLKVGDPFEPSTQMGPLANARRVEAMARLAEDARRKDATITGGQAIGSSGFYWAPTVFAGALDDCLAANEEPFGPIALLSPFKDLDDAVAKANRVPQALAAYAFTHDARVQAALRDQVEAGTLAFNHFQASWPETPFGGRGASGFGVEGGVEGLQAFQQIKFISAAGDHHERRR